MESPDIETYGKRLLPHIVDVRAKAGYSQAFAMYPKSVNAAEGFRSISYVEIANAVNRVSWWLDAELGEKEDTFVYFGPNDLRYIILVLATIKTGRKVDNTLGH
jgi:acyl-coenzyme A synthetase/AMP-(fatty) acid ligase